MSALNELAEDSDAFVLLPDPLVVQRSTLQNFLLHTYRLKKPVLAYSAPLTQSGALLSLYATPAQLGEEAPDWIVESWSRGEFHLGTPRYPKRFTISVNRTVAHSLDITLPGEAELTQRLEAMQLRFAPAPSCSGYCTLLVAAVLTAVLVYNRFSELETSVAQRGWP